VPLENRQREEGVIRKMAKAAPKGKKPAARAAKPKRAGSAAPKAAKAAAKPAVKVAKKRPLKAAKKAPKATRAAGKPASAAAKKVPVKGARAKKVNEGDRLYCEVCGLVVTVDDACGCAACDIICCDTQMQLQR
jgi:hypothetical protein